jgi:hypothetical protein
MVANLTAPMPPEMSRLQRTQILIEYSSGKERHTSAAPRSSEQLLFTTIKPTEAGAD